MWPTNPRFYELEHMAYNPTSRESRVVSPTECERLLGVPASWTHPGEEDDEDKEWMTDMRRRNAIGNAFAVPVVTRLLLALSLVHQAAGTSSFPPWRMKS